MARGWGFDGGVREFLDGLKRRGVSLEEGGL